MQRRSLVEESRRRVEETKQLAAASLEDLQRQHEALQGVDRVLDQSDDLLNRSMQLLRGMTWTGRLVNLIEQATSMRTKTDPAEHRYGKVIRPHATVEASTPAVAISPDDEATRELCRSVRELRAAGDLIASRVKANNDLLDKVAAKQDVALEKTYELTHQTSQVRRQGSVETPGFILHAIVDFDFYGKILAASFAFDPSIAPFQMHSCRWQHRMLPHCRQSPPFINFIRTLFRHSLHCLFLLRGILPHHAVQEVLHVPWTGSLQ